MVGQRISTDQRPIRTDDKGTVEEVTEAPELGLEVEECSALPWPCPCLDEITAADSSTNLLHQTSPTICLVTRGMMLVDNNAPTSSSFDLKAELRDLGEQMLRAFIGVMVLSYLHPKIEFNWHRVLVITLQLGTVLYVVEKYDNDLAKLVQMGLYSSLGSAWGGT